MELSVREVATLLGRSPRTVRAQVARGELAGVKRRGSWRIDRRRLPLTEGQRRVLQGKAEAVREAAEAALPSRLALSGGQKRRSVADLDAFRRGVELLAEMEQGEAASVSPELRQEAKRLLRAALVGLAEGVQQFDRELKLAALHRARGGLARAVAELLLAGGVPPREPLGSWVAVLEGEILPAVGGLTRWAEKLGKGGKR